MKLFRTPKFAKWCMPHRVWEFSRSNKVYLTFDDGPTPELTREILAILDDYNAKATFFCVGTNAKQYPELMDAIRSKGHQVGNHTMNHENGCNVSKKEYLTSIEEAKKYTSDTLFRPPYGRMPLRKGWWIKRDYSIIMWSWLSYDFDTTVSLGRILQEAEKIKGGDIIVLHDNQKVQGRITELLPQLMDKLREKGYEFGLISA